MKNISDIFRANYHGDDKSLQEALVLLKENGFTQIECLKLLIKELNLPLRAADKVILHSDAWREMRETNVETRDIFIDGLTDE